MSYNILNREECEKLKNDEPGRFQNNMQGGEYLDIQGLTLSDLDGIDTGKLNETARIMRGYIFSSVEASQSGHPGGSSGKVEQFLGLVLGGEMAIDLLDPKDPCRDRMIWSAGHCSPGLYGGLSLFYECLRRSGKDFDPKAINAVLPEDLVRFRRPDGPQGHIENYYPLSDFATGPSGHGFPSAGSMAIVHKSCGLDTKVWVLMGDAESEEGITYEARNLLKTLGTDNMIVSISYNHFGIDGQIEQVLTSPYINHWLGLGWNVIETDGHNILEIVYAYKKAVQGFENGNPTIILNHTIKGKHYGSTENSHKSHGAPAPHDEYVDIMKQLGFDIPGNKGEVGADISVVTGQISDELVGYITGRLDISKSNVKHEEIKLEMMKKALGDRPLVDPLSIKRPESLPKELVFAEGESMATRKAAGAFFEWFMKQTAFFWAGAGDLSGSVQTAKAEEVYGLISRENPYGRGIRYGIAEQNMCMMGSALTTDKLPGGFKPISVFGTYAVFSTMTGNTVRLTAINNHIYPDNKGFFIFLTSHDGPETGEDGPTHQGLYWMSFYQALPGVKVYKPSDANETVEMLFHALKQGEPIVLSVSRSGVPVIERGNGIPDASEAVNGAYICKNYSDNGNKKIVLVVCGGIMLNNTLEALPEIETQGFDVKVLNVTSPELFEDLRKSDPKKADSIFSDDERGRVVTLHAGWKGFLYPFLLPKDYVDRSIAIETYLKSGNAEECYELAELTVSDIKKKVLRAVC